MWFRNLQIYRLAQPVEQDDEALGLALAQNPARKCRPGEIMTSGWVSPVGESVSDLVVSFKDFAGICLQSEEKIIPSAGVRAALNERVAQIQQAEDRKIGRNERQQLQEEIFLASLPHALSRVVRTHAYIDRGDGLILVDTPTPAKAEALLSQLRSALGSLKVAPVSRSAPEIGAVMTRWLKESPPEGFTIGDRCELHEPGAEGGVVAYKRHALEGDELMAHLDAGKVVSRLALSWKDRVSCVLDAGLGIKQLKFLDLVQEDASAIETDSEMSRFNADFSLMTLELRGFLRDLFESLGGLREVKD